MYHLSEEYLFVKQEKDKPVLVYIALFFLEPGSKKTCGILPHSIQNTLTALQNFKKKKSAEIAQNRT